jgi:hypothetical protein
MKISPLFILPFLLMLGILFLLLYTPSKREIPARINAPIFGKAVTVCANLGGLTYVHATEDRERAGGVKVHAFCNLGAEVIVRMRYDGKPEGEAK